MITKAGLTERKGRANGTLVMLSPDALAAINARRAEVAAQLSTELPILLPDQTFEVVDLMQRPGSPTDRIGIGWPDRHVAMGVTLAQVRLAQ